MCGELINFPIKDDVITVMEIVRDLFGTGAGSAKLRWAGSTAVSSHTIGGQSLKYCTDESDVDILVPQPQMTSEMVCMALEAAMLMKDLPGAYIVRGDSNGDYGKLPISRRLIVKGLSRDIDLLFIRDERFDDYMDCIDSAVVKKLYRSINFSDHWKEPLIADTTVNAMLGLTKLDIDRQNSEYSRSGNVGRSKKVLHRARTLSEQLENYLNI